MIIIVLINFSSISANCQTTTDSCTCVSNEQLRKAAQLIERGKGYGQLLAVANEKIDSLNKRISIKEQLIGTYQAGDAINEKIKADDQKEIANLVNQRDIAVQVAKDINKLLRKQKRKTVIAVLSTIAIATGVHMLVK